MPHVHVKQILNEKTIHDELETFYFDVTAIRNHLIKYCENVCET